MNIILKNDGGFTLSEVLIAISIVAVACALAVPAFTKSVEWAKKRSALAELTQLNDALDHYRLEWGNELLPKGHNDLLHHEAILKILVLKNIQHINPKQLKSKGEGETFYFTEYRGQTVEGKENDSRAFTAYTTWKGSDEGGNNWKGNGCTLGEVFLTNEAWEKGDRAFKEDKDERIVEEVKELVKRMQPRQPFVEKKKYFEKPGSFDWIVPQGVSNIVVEIIGGGGSGAKVRRKVDAWGAVESMPSSGVQIGRYDCKQGNFVNVGSYNLTGPLKLYLYSSPTCFIESLNVLINGIDKRYLSLGQENVIECNQEGPLKTDFSVRTPQPQAGCWEKGKKRGRMRYHDNFAFTLNLRVQYPNFNFFVGHGGGAGGYSKKQFKGLHGGETVFVTVGKGGQDGSGEMTSVKINDIQFSVTGGRVGTDEKPGTGGVGITGDVNKNGAAGLTSEEGGKGGQGFSGGSNANIMMGAGGAGAVDKTSLSGESGNCGMVVITYEG